MQNGDLAEHLEQCESEVNELTEEIAAIQIRATNIAESIENIRREHTVEIDGKTAFEDETLAIKVP